MKKLFLLLALLGVVISATVLRAQHPKPAPHPITTVPQLTDSIQRIMRQEHIPGLLLSLVIHDSVLFEGGLGLADVENRRPVTAHTLFRMGSVTKTFVATGLLQLVEQGKLSLNDEVRKLAPEILIDNPWEATDPVRVVHVLEHTAGFDDMGINHMYNATATDPRGAAAVQVFRRELRCRWRPGERMSYANPGYQLAGYLLEKLSGQPYEQYLSQHLLRPLGMPEATADLRPAANPRLARGYRYADGRYQRIMPLPIYAGPAGSLSASAADMTRWVQFFLHDFRGPNGTALLRPAALHAMETAHTALGARTGVPGGYGLANMAMNPLGKAVFRGHGGSIGGFSSTFAYHRGLGAGYALSSNGDQRTSSIDKLVLEFLLRQVPPPPRPRLVPLDAAAVAPFLGHYQNEAPRQQLLGLRDYLLGDQRLTRRGPLLLLLPLLGQPDTLVPTGPLTFRRPREQFASMVLTHDHDGRRTLVTAKGYFLEASSGWWWLRPALLALSLLLVLTASLAGLVWLVMALRRRLPRAQVLPRLLPLLATTALLVAVAAFASLASHFWDAGHLSLTTGLIGVGPLAFAVFSLAGLLLTLRRFGQFRSRAVAWYLLLTYGALGWLAATLATYGWLSLHLWSV
ncbi:serine hydrolase domain-containing protein [Hymenobacter perfusus]|uniref:Class A beta-lactamase-related serine hydrolase n=1 Tax=Hymenobacter perfusus TaxID=1236770 RepID=A0A428KA27_9BACT|nr:serine hydrolase domain-containing protein [Hymenobacter perfusus]RSK43287.1 class A beta-lactamase-related serine hydrolase [Hymenobacter perfusus]